MERESKSGWTVDTLLALMNERDRRYEVTHLAAEKAIAVAERNAERWRDNANEWRQAMIDRERNFLPRNVGYIIGGLTILTLVLGLMKMVPA